MKEFGLFYNQKRQRKINFLKRRNLKVNFNKTNFINFKSKKGCVLSLINWHLEYYLKSGSHQMEFFIVGDDFKFSYQKNKKNLSYSYVKNQFRINLLSSSSLVKTNKEFANLIFKFKKKLLKV